MDLNFQLHEKQLEVYHSKARFKVGSCGRRGGKTFFAGFKIGEEALKNEKVVDGQTISLLDEEVWYISPTFDNAKGNLWLPFKRQWDDVIDRSLENVATIYLKNGRVIKFKGADRPDTLRGIGLSYVVLDEFAYMKPQVWELIVQPMLMRTQGEALFIGTPDAKNHFYDLFLRGQDPNEPEWESFQWGSADNPAIPTQEVEEMRSRMHRAGFMQEAEGKFVSGGSGHFKESYIQYADKSPAQGQIYITVDPAGYSEEEGLITAKTRQLDETAIAVCEVSPEGWFVHDIIHGRWGIRETSLRIVRAIQKYHPTGVGIEKGALKNAIMPYLLDQMRRIGRYATIQDLTHGGKKKTERIIWALQGRAEHGRIILKRSDDEVDHPPEWHKHFVEQLLDFPNPFAHDDLIDALAYIDQIATTIYYEYDENDYTYKDLDAVAGY